jgi:hypothetical protein
MKRTTIQSQLKWERKKRKQKSLASNRFAVMPPFLDCRLKTTRQLHRMSTKPIYFPHDYQNCSRSNKEQWKVYRIGVTFSFYETRTNCWLTEMILFDPHSHGNKEILFEGIRQ